jgi:hypothetical protein
MTPAIGAEQHFPIELKDEHEIGSARPERERHKE